MSKRDAWKDLLPAFLFSALKRMVNGSQRYGGASLDLHPSALLRELECELIDQPGWAYLSWRRIRKLRRALERADHCPLCGAPVRQLDQPGPDGVVL